MKNKDEKPNTAAINRMRNEFVKLGLRGQDLAQIMSAGKSRKEIAEDLKAYLKELPNA